MMMFSGEVRYQGMEYEVLVSEREKPDSSSSTTAMPPNDCPYRNAPASDSFLKECDHTRQLQSVP